MYKRSSAVTYVIVSWFRPYPMFVFFRDNQLATNIYWTSYYEYTFQSWKHFNKLLPCRCLLHVVSSDVDLYIIYLPICLMQTWLTPYYEWGCGQGCVSVSIHQAANSWTIYIFWALLSLPTQCFAAARQGSRTNVVMSWPTPAITSVRMRGCAH